MQGEETIAAIATPGGTGGLGVVRVSGENARAVGDRVFRSRAGRLADTPGYTARYGRVYDAQGEIDEAVALVFAAPHSYTGEDVVELSVHGGSYLLRRLLRALLDAGARLAGPGEFTKRAFLNGKMDLSEAESVMDLIGAQDRDAHAAALAGRGGALSREIGAVRDRLVAAAAALAAWTDYPEDDVPAVEGSDLDEALSGVQAALRRLLETYEQGRALRDGIDTVIAGRPNVGKSTLLNLLARTERSIVTEQPGTTRDIVEETVLLDGLRLRLADTAGLRETDDPVERIGVERAGRRIETAALVLAVLDGSRPLGEEDRRLIERLRGRPAVAVVNKSDLALRADLAWLREHAERVVLVSAAAGTGVDALARAVRDAAGLKHLDPNAAMLASERQRACAAQALAAVDEARQALAAGMTLDAAGVCIDDALAALFSLTGERVTEAVVDEVFARFCVGK